MKLPEWNAPVEWDGAEVEWDAPPAIYEAGNARRRLLWEDAAKSATARKARLRAHLDEVAARKVPLSDAGAETLRRMRMPLSVARDLVTREPPLARDGDALRTAMNNALRAAGLDPREAETHRLVTEAIQEVWVRISEPFYEREGEQGQTAACATAERALVGVVLAEPGLADVILPEVPAEDMRDPSCRAIWDAMIECRLRELTTDPVSVLAHLRTSGRIAVAGGGVFLSECMDHVVAPSFWAVHARIVREAGVHRRALAAAQTITDVAQTDSTGTEVVETAERAVDELGRNLTSNPPTSAREAIVAVMTPLADGSSALSTGLKDLDRSLGGGFRRGNMIVIAGRPGTGKSALGGQIAVNAAWRGGAVCFVTLEMTAAELAERSALGEANVEAERWRNRQLNPTEWSAMEAASSDLAKLRLWYVDEGTLTVSEMRRRVVRLHAEQGGLALVVVDYVQLLGAGEDLPRGRSREQEVALASRTLKAIAKDLDVPVLVLAQLNREAERRESKRPQLSDLRESGSMEQDADVVILLYREEMYEPQKPECRGIAELLVAKARSGRCGAVKVAWQASRTRFANLEGGST